MPEINRDELIEEVRKLMDMDMDEDELYAILGYQSLGLEERATEPRLYSFSITKSDLINAIGLEERATEPRLCSFSITKSDLINAIGLEERATELRLYSFSITKSDLIIKGKAYFERYKQQLKEKICDDWQYCKRRGEYNGDVKLLMDALIPIIITGITLPAPLIAVLCILTFKYGLDKLCGCKA